MVMINRATKEITFKVVYYGPGLCGKTTNLEYIYSSANPDRRGKMLTVATETDRTLFFDFMPLELGTIKGMKVRVQLYTVPGQVFYDATRRIVLRGSDGVVFVADSQAVMMDANVESLENLKHNLRLNSLEPETIPLVMQYNKQDLPGLSPTEEIRKRLNWRGVPDFTSVATVGTGVHETLRKIIELVIRKLQGQEAIGKKRMAPDEEAKALTSDGVVPAEATHPSSPERPPEGPLPERAEEVSPVLPDAEVEEEEAEAEVGSERDAESFSNSSGSRRIVAVEVSSEAGIDDDVEPLPEPEELPSPPSEPEPTRAIPTPAPAADEIKKEVPPAMAEIMEPDELEVDLDLASDYVPDDTIEPAILNAPPPPRDQAGTDEPETPLAGLADIRVRIRYFTERLQNLCDEAEDLKSRIEALEQRLIEDGAGEDD
jgi:signal recognition particle receptor subunit beta